MLHTNRIVEQLASCALVAILIVFGTPVATLAETSAELQAQLDSAREELDVLGHQVQAAGEDLHETQYQLQVTGEQIEETKGQIKQREAELTEAQDILAERVASNYKLGKSGLVSILLASSSFDDLLTNVYYAKKVYQRNAETIDNVKEARSALEAEQAELEEQQAEQKQLLEQQEAQVEQLEEQEAAQAAYVENLDAQVAVKLEEERQAEFERQRKEAEEAAARAAAEAEAAAKREAEEAAAREAAEVAAQQQEESDGMPTEVTSSTNGLSASQRNTIIAAAYTQVGVPYSFGASSPGSGFDCSGFTMWCYAQAGISLPHSSAAQCAISRNVSYSQLQPGNLVFWMGTGGASTGGNHVAIYLGDGMIIHANYNGVEAVPLYSGVTSYGVIG